MPEEESMYMRDEAEELTEKRHTRPMDRRHYYGGYGRHYGYGRVYGYGRRYGRYHGHRYY